MGTQRRAGYCSEGMRVKEMRQLEYVEGQKAQDNFEEGMKVLFKVPKDAVVKAEKRRKKKKASGAQSVRKPRPSDKD